MRNYGQGLRALLATITLTASGVIVASVLILRVPTVHDYVAAALTSHPGYPVGSTIDLPVDSYRTFDYTLFFFARNDCAACQASVPSFKAMTQLVSGKTSQRAMIVTFDDNGRLSEYAKALGLDQSRVLSLGPAASWRLKLSAVPTLVIVNRAGESIFQLVGRPSLVDQASIESLIASLR